MAKQYLFSIYFLLGLSSLIFAQTNKQTSTLSGTITLENETVIGATIQIEALKLYAVTDKNGEFSIKKVPYGTHEVSISYVGTKPFVQSLQINSPKVEISFELKTDKQMLESVVVQAESEETRLESLPVSISSLDVKALNSQALGAEEILKRSTGVVIRQRGGLGGNTTINLNGLTGQAVRIYYDGIPMDVYGGGIQINNIPVDALQRMDVYKGTMPIEVGTDALGGGINLVPLQSFDEYLRTSYSFGSFNTHRFTLSGLKNIDEKLSLSLISYLNHSDNDFEMRNIRNLKETFLENGTPVFKEEIINAKRFHNRHFSTFLEGAITLKNLSWADRLILSVSYTNRDDEIQQGRTLQAVAIGEASQNIRTFSQRLDYRNDFFDKKLNIRYFGILSHTLNSSDDSTKAVYNWTGKPFESIDNATGTEVFPIPTRLEVKNIGTAHRFILKYKISENLQLVLSDFYRYTRIDGNDPIGSRLLIDDELVDPNTIPSKLKRNIFGMELQGNFFEEKLTAIAFYKNYYYNAESIDRLQNMLTIIPVRKVDENFDGYGFALKYQITSSLHIRASHEQATRIPTEREIFGEGVIVPNYTLKPENSANWNVGFKYNTSVGKNIQKFFVQVEGFLRNRENLIRQDQFGPENSIHVNEDKVDGKGIEIAAGITLLKNLELTGNFTHQSNKISTPQLSAAGAATGAEVPNIPNLFYNLGASYKFEEIFNTEGSLSLTWNYFFVDRFSINEVKDLNTANPDFIIPKQHLHNIGVVYAPSEKGFKFSLNVRNILNNQIYDNFRIPRPGINYTVKVNYLL